MTLFKGLNLLDDIDELHYSSRRTILRHHLYVHMDVPQSPAPSSPSLPLPPAPLATISVACICAVVWFGLFVCGLQSCIPHGDEVTWFFPLRLTDLTDHDVLESHLCCCKWPRVSLSALSRRHCTRLPQQEFSLQVHAWRTTHPQAKIPDSVYK